jgi:NitT/TauT family transport system permease protein
MTSISDRPLRTPAGRSLPRFLPRLASPPLVALAVLLVAWTVFSIDQPAYLLPGPLAVLERFWDLTVISREIWGALALSMSALVIGAVLSLAVGAPLGILMGASRTTENVIGPYVNALYVAPVSALTPLFVWWFGIGLEPRVATVFVFAAPIVILTCYRGAREVPRTFVEVARVFGASDRQVFRLTIVPHAIPYIVTALRLGLGRAIKGTVLAELVVSITGLGQLLSGFATVYDTASLIAVLLFLLLLGVVLQAIVARMEVAIAPWRQGA